MDYPGVCRPLTPSSTPTPSFPANSPCGPDLLSPPAASPASSPSAHDQPVVSLVGASKPTPSLVTLQDPPFTLGAANLIPIPTASSLEAPTAFPPASSPRMSSSVALRPLLPKSALSSPSSQSSTLPPGLSSRKRQALACSNAQSVPARDDSRRRSPVLDILSRCSAVFPCGVESPLRMIKTTNLSFQVFFKSGRCPSSGYNRREDIW
ncbi:hypothetical protein C8R45DRAFT_1018134 [Mycena sanguinolenta]|nr:hypothetical protein C8R45DRAFT_1018134 [Mycena sanguinolenta]